MAVGGFVQGLAGFGLALLVTPVLALVLPVKETIPITAICGSAMNVLIVLTLLRHVRWKPALALGASAAPGVLIGARVLRGVPPALIVGSLGVILIALALFHLCEGNVPQWLRGKWLTVASGFLSGAIGAATGAPGPPLIAYLRLQAWDVRERKAVMNVFFSIQALFVIPAYLHAGLINHGVLAASKLALPSVLAGVAAGMTAAHLLHGKGRIVQRIIDWVILALGFVTLANAFGLL